MNDQEFVWCIVEQLGHVRYAGRVTEEEKFGVKMLRLDIPDGDGFVTKYLGGSTLYSVTVVTEAVARHVAQKSAPAPVSPWDFPKQLAAEPRRDLYGEDDDDHEDETPY